MSELGIWLLALGFCDLVRAARDVTSMSRRLLIGAIGSSLLLLGALALHDAGSLGAGQWLLLLAGWGSAFWVWLLGSAAALSGGGAGARTAAFLGLGGGVVFSILVGDLAGESAVHSGLGLPPALQGLSYELLLVGAGVLVVQLATANIVVRLVLDAVGVPASTNEKQLKGGRLLGPMERLFIVGLGMAGQLTAAAIVVAAKGLLRFPELQWGSRLSGPSDVTEYFLIGSFTSWLFALSGLGLLALG